MSLAGRLQADATAAAAAELARALATGEIDDAGVRLPEQVVSAERFFDALSTLGWMPVLEELAPARPECERAPSVREVHS